jgi:hypothetical protein
MDEELRTLQRAYQATGDQTAASKMILASMRAYNIDGEITAYFLENTHREWDEREIIYISWNPKTNLVRIIIAAYEFYDYDDLSENRPTPRLPEHMTQAEKNRYEEQLDKYQSQALGQIQLFLFKAQLRDDLTWENFEMSQPWNTLDIYEEKLGPEFFSYSGYSVFRTQLPTTPEVVILNTLNMERDLEGKVETIDEPSEINTEFGNRCEDYPCCGHDICPRYWTSGERAEVICECGASLPSNSRFSICESCLRRHVEGDSPYDYDPDYGPDYDDDYLDEDEPDYDDDYPDEY